MAKLTQDQIALEIESKGYKVIDTSHYENLDSDIIIECNKGHRIVTNLKSFRHPSFECPYCAAKEFKMEKPHGVPLKHGYRIIAFDQATENMGMSMYEDGKLIYYDLFRFNDGLLINRLVKIQELLEKVVIPVWQPDFLIFEDIQQQGPNIVTYKILSMLLGICEVTAKKFNIEYDVVPSSVWRSTVGIVGRGTSRVQQKQFAIDKVKQLLGVIVTDDVAEAILIGKYATTKKKNVKLF